MKRRILKNMEWSVLVCSILLLCIGMVALYSASQQTEYEELKKQIMWAIISIPVIIIVIFIDYNFIAKLSPYFYGIFIILLIAVLFTEPINGATSWFNIGGFSFQPGEFAKVFVIIFLAYVISKIQAKGKEQINKPLKLLIVIATVALPVLLIVKQPDYGTAIAFLMATAFMIFSSGIKAKYIIITLLVLAILLPLLYIFVLPGHAKERIEVFLNPTKDPRGAGYNIIQSKLAIGARTGFWNGNFKRKSNTIRIFISKNNRFYFCGNW